MPTVTQQLYSVVKNPTASTRTYSFLPPHGITLEPGESVNIRGNLVDRLGGLPRRRKLEALQKCLTDATLTVVSLPATNTRVGNATLVAGTVTIANTSITANTIVSLTRKTIGGTVGNLAYTLSAGTSFTITSSSATDTSVVSYILIEA